MNSEEMVRDITKESKWYLSDMELMQSQWKQDVIDLQKGFQERWRKGGRATMSMPIVEYTDCVDGAHEVIETLWMSDDNVEVGDTVVIWGWDKFRILSRKAVVKSLKLKSINNTGNMFHSYITYPPTSQDK